MAVLQFTRESRLTEHCLNSRFGAVCPLLNLEFEACSVETKKFINAGYTETQFCDFYLL